jgi:hypothetical protein
MKIRRLLPVLCLLPGAFAPQTFAQLQVPFPEGEIRRVPRAPSIASITNDRL